MKNKNGKKIHSKDMNASKMDLLNNGFHKLVQNIKDYDIILLDPEGIVMAWNIGAENIKGYKAREIIGKHFSFFYLPEDIASKRPELALKIAKEQGRFEEEGWRVNKKGQKFWANEIIIPLRDDDQNLIGYGQITKDLSQQKKSEDFLRQSEERMRTLIEASKDYAIIMLDADGIIINWNTGAQLITGYTTDEAIGKHFSILYPPEIDINLIKNELHLALKNDRYEIEGWRIRKDHSKFWANSIINALYNSSGTLLGFSKIMRDLTERKKIETMKNEFISVVSHELRTPLTSIQGALSLLLSGYAGHLPESANKLLNIGKQNSERLIRLINNILDIEKIESGKMEFISEPVPIDLITREAILANESFSAKFNIKLKLIQKTTALVNVDRDKLMQVLTNLLSNAIKFSTPGTEVEICLQREMNTIEVLITNKGPGIPKDFQSKIFEKFAQADATSKRGFSGTGLGLSICKEIMKKLGGKISFNSVPHKKTTFTLQLPIYEKRPTTNKIFAKVPVVLLCEADPSSSNSLKMILEKHGCKALITNTAKEAKEIIADYPVDVLLLDLVLPDQDGIELIKELRNHYSSSELSIIVISVMAQECQAKLKGNAVSVLDWLEKPIDLPRFLKLIKLLKKQTLIKYPKILHVEDDPDLTEVIAQLLQGEGTVIGVTTVSQAKKALESSQIDLVLLDLMLPDGSGIDLLPMISKKHIPVIVFSAYELPKDYSQYVVASLYKSKASPYELLENINAALDHNKILKPEEVEQD